MVPEPDPGTMPSPHRLAAELPPTARGTASRRRGFTIGEILVMLTIIGVLAAAQLPNYVRGVQRAKRTESLSALRAIHDAQTFHFATENEYSDSFSELAFEIDDGAPLPDGSYRGRFYTYTLDRWDVGEQVNANFRATATGNPDASDATLDIVIIENAITVMN